MNRTALLIAFATVFSLSLCHADTYRFDMGGPATPVAAGFTRVTAADIIGEGKSFGWAKAPAMVVYRNEPTNPWFAQADSLEYALYSDGLLSIEENTFILLVKPGRYAVTAIIGDLALGEGRPGNSIWANEAKVVSDVTTDASVKAFTFPVDAPDGRIALRFRADSPQRYSTVEGVTAEPLAAGQELTLSEKQYPEASPTKETYLRNWDALQDRLLADWAQAKAELTAEGVDLQQWGKLASALQQKPDYRQYWAWSLGGGSWERLAAQTGSLDISRLCVGFKEMGINGFQTNSAMLSEGLTKAGLRHACSGSAESFPRADLTGVPLNLMKSADGSTKTIDKVWSNMSPEAIATFQQTWRDRIPPAAASGASFFLIDEPRGMWYAGTFGDYSAPAQEAFKRWCAEQGYTELATKGIPERGRNLDFYRFYQFRLQSVAMFAKAFTKDTPVENVPIAPGNGNVGPEQMNHNSYWPPAMAKRGMISACWAYDDTPSCKAYAETVAMAREFGGQSIITPPLYPEKHTPLEALPMHVACASAMTDRVVPWHFGGPLNGPNRPAWMKDTFYSARLTHAMTGLRHTPPVYVWCPESIVYNDLVEMNRDEAQRWRVTWQALYDANLDYAVTNTLDLPAGAVVIYSCAKPVLNEEEFGRLQAFLAKGGTLLCAFEGQPEGPEGRAIEGWQKLPAKALVRMEMTTADLQKVATPLRSKRNWSPETAALKTYLYARDGKRVHLLNNTSLTAPARLALPCAATDLLSGKALPKGSTLSIPAGMHALVAER
jgi:hypothetical protein